MADHKILDRVVTYLSKDGPKSYTNSSPEVRAMKVFVGGTQMSAVDPAKMGLMRDSYNVEVTPDIRRFLKREKLIERNRDRYYPTEKGNDLLRELGPVNVDENGNVVRYHATDKGGLLGIADDGAIKTRHSDSGVRYTRKGYWPNYKNTKFNDRRIYRSYERPVFTSLDSWADKYDRPYTLRLSIPEQEYSQMKRELYNPDHSPRDIRDYILSVDRGGYSDFIGQDIPVRYVDQVCLDPELRECYDTSEIPFIDIARKAK